MALVPGVLALLPEYAGLVDPVAELRAACLEAVAWLAEAGPVAVLGSREADQGLRVAQCLAAEAGVQLDLSATRPPSVLVVANGSARRTEKAPGFLDERAAGFDTALARVLTTPDPAALDALDLDLADELLVGNPTGIRMLSRLLTAECRATVDYDDDPFGVQYWVVRWRCES